jgi:hypothetical protein
MLGMKKGQVLCVRILFFRRSTALSFFLLIIHVCHEKNGEASSQISTILGEPYICSFKDKNPDASHDTVLLKVYPLIKVQARFAHEQLIQVKLAFFVRCWCSLLILPKY